MKPFNELSDAGKLRRLRELALAALRRYELADPEIAYHGFDTNLLYRVTTASGARYVLRLAYPGWRTLDDLRAEAVWLEAIGRDTGILAPRAIPARSGEQVLPVCLPEIPTTWNATLMTWVPGRLLGHYLTRRNLEKMGRLFAQLHQHGAAWVPPPGFTTRRFEHWLSRGEENRITGAGERPPGLPSCSLDLLERVDHHVEQAYASVDRSDLRVIHCDLWHDNIKLDQGALHPFDFEDTVWGFRAHDIAMAMLDLLEVVDETRYVELLAAFRRGYEAELTWPEDCIEPFQIGRLLWMINWVARRRPQALARMVEQHTPVLEHYEMTGQVKRPPAV
jgi:Ser/Thr protein kinase RdoA (MazF antagonist)